MAFNGTWTGIKDGDTTTWCIRIEDIRVPGTASKIEKRYKGQPCWMTSKSGKKSKVIVGDCISVRDCVLVFRVDEEATAADRAAYFAKKNA